MEGEDGSVATKRDAHDRLRSANAEIVKRTRRKEGARREGDEDRKTEKEKARRRERVGGNLVRLAAREEGFLEFGVFGVRDQPRTLPRLPVQIICQCETGEQDGPLSARRRRSARERKRAKGGREREWEWEAEDEDRLWRWDKGSRNGEAQMEASRKRRFEFHVVTDRLPLVLGMGFFVFQLLLLLPVCLRGDVLLEEPLVPQLMDRMHVHGIELRPNMSAYSRREFLSAYTKLSRRQTLRT